MREDFWLYSGGPFGRGLAVFSKVATLRWLRIFSGSDFFCDLLFGPTPLFLRNLLNQRVTVGSDVEIFGITHLERRFVEKSLLSAT